MVEASPLMQGFNNGVKGTSQYFCKTSAKGKEQV